VSLPPDVADEIRLLAAERLVAGADVQVRLELLDL